MTPEEYAAAAATEIHQGFARVANEALGRFVFRVPDSSKIGTSQTAKIVTAAIRAALAEERTRGFSAELMS